MANPFLFTDDDIVEPVSSNPFFDADPAEEVPDNPFLSDSNPFASFAEPDGGMAAQQQQQYIEQAPDMMNYQQEAVFGISNELLDFGGDKENQIQNSVAVTNDVESSKKSPPERPAPPREMADLISTLSTQLDMTSNKLLGQIPATRTPSPVSMRDLHTPSPTPENQFDDLMGVSELPTDPEPQQQQQQQDMMDLMETDNSTVNAAPVTKSKEDILNLFNPPAEKKPVDFLCDDNIAFEPPAASSSDVLVDNVVVEPTVTAAPATNPDELLQITEEQQPIPEEPVASVVSPPHGFVMQDIQIDVEDVDFGMPNSYDICVTPPSEKEVSSGDVSESHIAYSHSNISINDDASSVSSAVNPFMMETTSDPEPTPVVEETYHAPPPRPQPPARVVPEPAYVPAVSMEPDKFDLFAAKFEESKSKRNSLTNTENDFQNNYTINEDAWGSSAGNFANANTGGFDGFDADDNFSAMEITPDMISKPPDFDSDEETKHMSVVIRPQGAATQWTGNVALAPPPKPVHYYQEEADEQPAIVNPFEQHMQEAPPSKFERTASQETPPTPLFDEDVSQPLEEFPRIHYVGNGWEMQLRSPKQKKITGQRFWKKIWVRLIYQNETPVVQLFNQSTDKDPFQEIPLQPTYSVSEIGAQQYDQYGKIFTIKLQYVFYKERPGVRPGQVTKAERITNKLSRFAAYAIQGDYEGVKEFGSDLKKLGLPVEHAPQASQLLKVGSMNYEDMKQFSMCIEEALFKMPFGRERALTYKMEEVQVTAVDEIYAEADADGHVSRQIARVRLFFLSFLTGMPTIELGVNEVWRQGREVVGRHDIIPVATEEWIRLENVEFHNCVQLDEYEKTRTIRFKPPDACYIELMRFRVRPPKNRELPLQLKAQWVVMGKKVELRADVLVPGYASRSLGQIPCEDVAIRFPIPECWIYLFRVEKHFRYGSVKSAHRRTGKVKGIERILGTMETLQESLIEVTSGQAKYEHHHKALVWRCPRLPKDGQGAYTTHNLVCRLALTGYDQVPPDLAEYAYVEFTMPACQVSHTTVRSVSVQESDSDDPPEKYVRHLARHEYRVGIEKTSGDSLNPYLAATIAKPAPVQEEPELKAPSAAPSDSDSDSN